MLQSASAAIPAMHEEEHRVAKYYIDLGSDGSWTEKRQQ